MSTYVIYARKSSEDEDRQILSISAQVTELRELARSRGISIAHVYEESQSARRTGRPVFMEMMREIDRKKISGILCWKPDRLARNMVDGGWVIDSLDRQVLREIVTPGRTTRNNSDDKFFLSLEFGISKKMVDDLSDNVRRGNRAVVSSGRVTGMVPIGYLKDLPLDRSHGRGAGKTVIDPDRFPLVKELFQRYLTGAYSVPRLHAHACETLGLRTHGTRRHPPGFVNIGSLYSILKNPFYAGFIRHGGEIYRGDHEPVVSKAEFDRIQELLGRHDAPRPVHREFDFVGLIRCGRCGRAVTGEEHTNRHGSRYVYYRCSRKRVGEVVCREPYVPEPQVEEQLKVTVGRLFIPEQLLVFAWAKLDNEAVRLGESSVAVIAGLRKEIAAMEAELDRLTRLCTRGLLPEDDYVRTRMSLLAELDGLHKQIEAPNQMEADVDAKLRDVLALAAMAPNTLAHGTQNERREMLGKVCTEIKLADRKLSVELRRPYSVLSKSLPTVLSQLKDSNPSENSQNSNEFKNSEMMMGTQFAQVLPLRNATEPNPRFAAQQNEKIAEIDPVISSWCALIDEVRNTIKLKDAEN